MSVATNDVTGVHVTSIVVKHDGERPVSAQLNNNSKTEMPVVNENTIDEVMTQIVEDPAEVAKTSTEVVETSAENAQNSTEIVQTTTTEIVQTSSEVAQTSTDVVHTSTEVTQSSQETTQDCEKPSADAESGVPVQDTQKQGDHPLWTSMRNGAVKLRIATNGPGSEAPHTVPTMLQNAVEKYPNVTAMAVKRDGAWVKWTYKQYMEDVRKAAKSFMKLGLEPYHGVGIMGFNSPEWFIADLGCIFAGGLTTGIYTTNSPEACQYVANSSQSNVLVVENETQLKKILQVRDKLRHLKAIVQYTGSPERQAEGIYSWAQFMELGADVPDSQLDEQIKSLVPNKCCMLIYTSGTTGNPKGVMLSHDNITWTMGALRENATRQVSINFGDVSIVSYLPLSHIAAQLLDIFVIIGFGGTTYFAQPDALKGSLVDTLREVRPHVLLGVPRVWEKFQERMQTAALSITGLKRRISRWAKGVGVKGNYAIMSGRSAPLTMSIADKILFKRVRTLLGMDRCVLRLSGAAPITKETLEYFMGVNQPLCEVYGMSESSGPHTVGYPRMNKVGSVGTELKGITTELREPDEDGNGEIVMHGRHVFMGYLNEEEKTRETLDSNGGLRSGDVGKKDKDGFLHITGRIKELIITAGGENVAPVPIEDKVKEMLPVVSQCMLIGDKRKFLSMLITLKVVVDPDTQEPQDTLSPVARAWVREQGSEASTVSGIMEPGDQVVLQALQRGIDRVNQKAISNAQKIQKWSLLLRDFSIPGGELGPTMKLKRSVVHAMYKSTIDAFYEDQASACTSATTVTVTAASAAASPPGATALAASAAPAAAATSDNVATAPSPCCGSGISP